MKRLPAEIQPNHLHYPRQIGKTLPESTFFTYLTPSALGRPRLTQFVLSFRSRFRRIYGPGYAGRKLAADSEPPWLSAVWRAFGVIDLSKLKFRKFDIQLFTIKRLIQDSEGVWWCESSTDEGAMQASWRPRDFGNKITTVGIDPPGARYKFATKVNVPIRPIVTPSAADLEEMADRVFRIRKVDENAKS